MNKLPEKLKILNEQLEVLDSSHGFSNCQKVVDSVIALLGISSEGSWKLFTDSQGKIRSNASWFKLAEGFADKRASYKIVEGNPANIDLKAYWMKNLSKSIISWLVALTPNFEDEPFYSKKNIGIDFIIPESADRIIVVLSSNYVIRTLELHGQLSLTQQEIFAKWLVQFDFENKAQVHKVLWDSFDLEPLNKNFYKEISSFFVELTQHLSTKKIFDDKHAAFFTNRLIGRIVFCWLLDKKGIINPDMKYFDTENQEATDYYHTKLETLFFRVFNTPIEERDALNIEEQKHLFPETKPKNLFNTNVDFKTPFLNGGLFEIRENDKYGDPSLVFPADFFDRFYTFLRHYNFTTDESTSSFQQVAIDPEMLGRIFENLLAEQVEETGEQARKAKGAFYTPREIVDYMCKESLREYLKTKIKESHDRDQRIGQLLDSKPHEWRDQQRNYRDKLKPYKAEIIDALDNIKVIDPACGSGAFPMGMLHLLLQCYERLEPRFDSYKNKLEIIKNNLYGVDIEPMAVEISRLRAWLSIIVDEDVDSKKIKPLPNLDFKFVCANSLIPLEKGQQSFGDDTDLEDKILEIRDKYYNARKLAIKLKLREQYDKLIVEKKQKSLFGKSQRQEQLATYHPFDSEQVCLFFDPDFMFG
ncbi:MAG: DNA methyltransferase, partial [Candidatus Hodarchaeales archaeon]